VNPLAQRLADALAQSDFATLENLWLELFEADAIPADALARLLGQLLDIDEGPRALDLAMALAPDLVGAERYAEALPLLRAVAPAAQGDEEVRAALLDCYRHIYQEVRHLGACIDRSGLLTTNDLATAVRTLDGLLAYRQGDYFYHAAGWGMGRISGFDPLDAAAIIDFENKPAHTVPLEGIETLFEPLDPNDFRVLRKTDPERLRKLAQDDPAALIRMALRAHDGRLTLRGIRGLLAGDIVPAETWSKWWAGARAELKRDPLVAIGTGSNPLFTLRAEALAYEEEMRARFEKVKDLPHQTKLLREYADHMAKDADPAAFLTPAAQTIAARITQDATPGAAYEASLLLTRLDADAGEFPTPEQILDQQTDPIPLLNELTTSQSRRHAFAALRERSEDWKAACHRILLRGPRELWESAAAALPETGEPPSIESLVQEVRDEPTLNLALFAWLCRGLFLKRWSLAPDPKPIFEQLLSEGDTLARRKAQQRWARARFDADEALAAVRQSLRAGELRYFQAILEDISEVEATRLLFRIRQSSVLGATLARTLESRIVRRYPRLLVEEEKPEAAAPEFIYAMPEGIERRRKEHEHLVNVEIPKNSEDIRRAVALGDITDSADWRTAIEQQRLLTARAAQITEELQRARPIEPSMVHTDHVSIGSRITVENTETGERATYSLLGTWDTDPERGIIAYNAPLAQALMRHRVGDEVTFTHAGEQTTYRIVAIENALEKKE